MASWVISSFCTQCGQPHRICPVAQLGEIRRKRFEQQDDIAVADQLLAGQ
jgi:hypothetical protein